jgi:hypothetical protein
MKKNGEKSYEGNFASLLEGIGLSHEEIDRLAREAGMVKRTPRKISAQTLVCLLLQESVRGTVSYNDLAARLEAAEILRKIQSRACAGQHRAPIAI